MGLRRQWVGQLGCIAVSVQPSAVGSATPSAVWSANPSYYSYWYYLYPRDSYNCDDYYDDRLIH